MFLVTGAAGSIVSAIVIDLAAASGGTFHLVDLVAEPDRDDPDLARFAADRDGLKRELADRIRERGERPTPKLVERDLARIERGRAALDAIEAIERAGGTVHWHQVDLTDAKAVATAVKGALKESGKIDVVLHAAGLEISHFLPDKPQSEYDLVFDVKAHGWLNLLAGFGAKQPGTAVMFSSIAGRFGNGGQTDYSAANDLLCKSASHMRRGADTRGVTIDWTAWASIGMASRGSIPKMMEVAGIDMLPVEVGVPVVRRELTAAGSGGEVLEGGSLGVLEEERHPTGGLDGERATEACAEEAGPMTGRIESFTARGQVTVVTDLDPNRQPFLFDHRIDGTPVLPGVMGMEGFAEAAAALVPGFHVVELTDVDLLAPFKFYRDEPRPVILRAMLTDGGDGTLLADCELIGRRELHGQGRAGDSALRRPRAARPQGAGRAEGAHASGRPEGRGRWSRRGLWRLFPRSGVPGARAGVARRRSVRRAVRRRAAGQPRAGEPDDRDRPAADRALLPDRRRVGARVRGPDGAADPRRPGRPLRFGEEAEPSVGRRHPSGRRRDERRDHRRGRSRSGEARGLPDDRAAG